MYIMNLIYILLDLQICLDKAMDMIL